MTTRVGFDARGDVRVDLRRAYPLFGRNLWPLILVHGFSSSVAIWSVYAA